MVTNNLQPSHTLLHLMTPEIGANFKCNLF